MDELKQHLDLHRKWIVVLCVCMGLFTFCTQGEKQETEPEWISLFNGENLEGWTPKFAGHELGENVLNTFRVEDSLLKVSYEQYDEFNNRFGHLFYKDKFSHYKLRAEYRFVGEQVKGGADWAFRNSGLMIHCQSPKTLSLEQSFPVCIEVQLLGGNGQDERTTANLCTPGTNVVMNGELETDHCINSSSPTFHGDQWVTVTVEVYGDSTIKHFVNGELVMQYDKPQLDPEDEMAQPFVEGDNLLWGEGYISLQAESHPVEFRKVELLPLKQ